jgi:RHH-type proline utilization regulon transcriptional repressor/proline dehydrogenase/delta 1-pyrroline-5-carboxylate dehydrogenase
MRTLLPPAPGSAAAGADREQRVRALGRRIAAGQAAAGRGRTRALEDRGMELLSRDPALKAALFRLVDVAPACSGPREVAAHLASLLGEVERPLAPPGGARSGRRGPLRGSTWDPVSALAGAARNASLRPATRGAVGTMAGIAVHRMAKRFIVGAAPQEAVPALERLWLSGAATSVDLLGEATVTAAEADRYARRCDEALRTLAQAVTLWPARPVLEADSHGPIARVNLSVKVTALTARVRAEAPELGIDDARHRLRALLRTAKDVGAHLHVDMESMDSRDLVTELVIQLLNEPEFRHGPSAGIVLQAYLRDADEQLDRLLDGYAAAERTTPLTIRLVKGAYWEHETVEARQNGWTAPVFEAKVESDRNFERLTRRLIASKQLVRPAIASHNVRSIAHALAHVEDTKDVEFQVLRGLGDDLQQALAGMDLRVRTYCPVGDLVAGMSYLVRRLLENTSNDSFLLSRSRGDDLDQLLAAP